MKQSAEEEDTAAGSRADGRLHNGRRGEEEPQPAAVEDEAATGSCGGGDEPHRDGRRRVAEPQPAACGGQGRDGRPWRRRRMSGSVRKMRPTTAAPLDVGLGTGASAPYARPTREDEAATGSRGGRAAGSPSVAEPPISLTPRRAAVEDEPPGHRASPSRRLV
ncbi:hypothetical protein E2562_037963 [Oryza meyeriana var. granulata]|uniref:DUF834 domain-containing protein n=1 Tax=Oryza meyeriana var. granulata TaxID=110450 RepID=A0A6G1CKC3_9ORYZ|nr:hypothetical protein E2562_037963 [Oryza meyeriana var. granulata]